MHAGAQEPPEAGGTGDLVEIADPRGNLTKIACDTSHGVTRIVRVTATVDGTGPTTYDSAPE